MVEDDVHDYKMEMFFKKFNTKLRFVDCYENEKYE